MIMYSDKTSCYMALKIAFILSNHTLPYTIYVTELISLWGTNLLQNATYFSLLLPHLNAPFFTKVLSPVIRIANSCGEGGRS